ncbi:vWA domain-containing protein [Amycolatopsis sp. cmx-4-61]|uniref:vWA domain-containing protein n=1 Tax=Amycolatopsis sp. cmx-4-61 TaxID=2790937 RepID=UPI00397CDE61
MPEERAKILPFYLVIDVSWSMDGEQLQNAGNIMPELSDALAKDPILTDKIRFALIDFAGDAQVRLPLCDVLDPDVVLPGLACRGATSYAAAFRLLRKEIEANVTQLKADGFSVHRPAVFFLTDGVPTDADDEWNSAFRELTEYDRQAGVGFAMYPNVIPFGVKDADPQVLRRLVHPSTGAKQSRMYLMDEGNNPAQAIAGMAEIMVSSVLSSGANLAGGDSGLIHPDPADLPAGITAANADGDFL